MVAFLLALLAGAAADQFKDQAKILEDMALAHLDPHGLKALQVRLVFTAQVAITDAFEGTKWEVSGGGMFMNPDLKPAAGPIERDIEFWLRNDKSREWSVKINSDMVLVDDNNCPPEARAIIVNALESIRDIVEGGGMPPSPWGHERRRRDTRKQHWRNNLSVGDVIDAKDSEGRWFDSRIVAIEGDRVKVHNNGWSAQWDYWLDRTDESIQPLFTHTDDWRRLRVGDVLEVRVPGEKALWYKGFVQEVDGSRVLVGTPNVGKQWLETSSERICKLGTHINPYHTQPTQRRVKARRPATLEPPSAIEASIALVLIVSALSVYMRKRRDWGAAAAARALLDLEREVDEPTQATKVDGARPGLRRRAHRGRRRDRAARTAPALAEQPPVPEVSPPDPGPESEPEAEPAPKRAHPVQEPAAPDSKCEEEEPDGPAAPAVPRGFETVAHILEAHGESRLLATFVEQQINDETLPFLEASDLLELGVSPMAILAIVDTSSAARGKAKKLVTDDLLDVAKHQSVLEETLRAHRAEIARLQIGRGEFPSKFYCCITTEVMSDPCMAADGHTYERCAIDQWFATGARTSPTTNEPLPSLQLIPNHALRAMIVEELERRGGHAS